MTEVGSMIQVVRSHDGRYGGYRGKVREILEIEGMKLFVVQWENTGRFGVVEPGFSTWINLGKGPPAKDLSKDAEGGNYSEQALLGQRRRR